MSNQPSAHTHTKEREKKKEHHAGSGLNQKPTTAHSPLLVTLEPIPAAPPYSRRVGRMRELKEEGGDEWKRKPAPRQRNPERWAPGWISPQRATLPTAPAVCKQPSDARFIQYDYPIAHSQRGHCDSSLQRRELLYEYG